MIQGLLRRASTDMVQGVQKLLSMVMPYRPMGQGQALLDSQYEAADWDYLRSAGEAPRFGVVAAYCQYLSLNGSVLEIGCGEGILFEHLHRARISEYVGVDISTVAIDRARAFEGERVKFVCADADVFEPKRKFDIIVFNEVLEYFDDPAALVLRYEPFLADGGKFVVSMFSARWTARTRHIWRALQARYEVAAHTRVATSRDHLWNIKVLDPRVAAHGAVGVVVASAEEPQSREVT
jgi:2-polyprenyl-6-hydroxyphenyl methylase/3-demethylubiquinone-9 3-methyltransferase